MSTIDRLRERAARRQRAARLQAQQDVLRKWGKAALERAGFTPEQAARSAVALFRAGLPLGEAEQAVHLALRDAQAAYRAALLQHSTTLASDSENTDTGRLRRL